MFQIVNRIHFLFLWGVSCIDHRSTEWVHMFGELSRGDIPIFQKVLPPHSRRSSEFSCTASPQNVPFFMLILYRLQKVKIYTTCLWDYSINTCKWGFKNLCVPDTICKPLYLPCTLYTLQTVLCEITLNILLLLVLFTSLMENSHSCFSYNLLCHWKAKWL